MARDGASPRCMTFGEQADADISLVRADWGHGAWQVGIRTPLGDFDASLHIAGRHNVVNALAATACALAAGVSLETIAAGLTKFEPVKGRSKASEVVLPGGHSLTLVDDTYNANPDSVRAAIDVLAALPGPRLLVLGDMGEVGDHALEFHTEVGDWARQRGIEARVRAGCRNGAQRCRIRRWKQRQRWAGTSRRSMRSTPPCSRGLPQVGERAGQGLALHEDGAGGAGHRAITTTTKGGRS